MSVREGYNVTTMTATVAATGSLPGATLYGFLANLKDVVSMRVQYVSGGTLFMGGFIAGGSLGSYNGTTLLGQSAAMPLTPVTLQGPTSFMLLAAGADVVVSVTKQLGQGYSGSGY